MKVTLLSFLVLTSVIACKIDGSNDPAGPGPGRGQIGGMEEPISELFSIPELQIGRRICTNLITKRSTLEVLRQDQTKKLIFKINAKACEAMGQHMTDVEFGATVALVGIDYELVVPNRNDYFKDFITEQSGVMKEVCEELSVSSNTIKRQLPIGNSNFVIKFLVKDSYDRVEITQYSPNSKGGYMLNNVEGISFVTTVKQGPKELIGLEKERSRYTYCPKTPNTPAYLIQAWMR